MSNSETDLNIQEEVCGLCTDFTPSSICGVRVQIELSVATPELSAVNGQPWPALNRRVRSHGRLQEHSTHFKVQTMYI